MITTSIMNVCLRCPPFQGAHKIQTRVSNSQTTTAPAFHLALILGLLIPVAIWLIGCAGLAVWGCRWNKKVNDEIKLERQSEREDGTEMTAAIPPETHPTPVSPPGPPPPATIPGVTGPPQSPSHEQGLIVFFADAPLKCRTVHDMLTHIPPTRNTPCSNFERKI